MTSRAGTKEQCLSTICLMVPVVQCSLKAKSGPLKVGKAPLFELDGALAHSSRRALPLTRLFSFSFRSLPWPRHSNISFSCARFVLCESNAANQRHDNIFHQLGDPGQEPSSFGKNQAWLFIMSLCTCGPAFKVHKPVPININYSQTAQRLKQSRLKSVYGS